MMPQQQRWCPTSQVGRTSAILSLLLAMVCVSACVPQEDDATPFPIIVIEEDQGTADLADSPDMSEDMAQSAPDQGEPGIGCEGAAFSGELYQDNDLSSYSRYSQRIGDDDVALEGEALVMIGANGKLRGKSCEGGRFGVEQLEDGAYVFGALDAEGRTSASSSQGMRFVQAIDEGKLDMVVFGDSIPVYGPKPFYPEVFKGMISPMAEVTLNNVAVAGTRSIDWLPQTDYYRERLLPHLESADLIVFSIGGNDLYAFASGDVDVNDPAAAIERFDEELAKIIENIKTITTTIRMSNASADIVWMLYPNYATSEKWAARIPPDLISTIEQLLARKLAEIRRALAHHEGMMIWDIYGATKGLDLDMYLFDELHLNVLGHQLWARNLFLTLGGVIIEGGVDIEAEPRQIGLSAPSN